MSAMTYLITGGTNNYYISATRMTDTTAIIAFSDVGDASKGKAVKYDATSIIPAISNSAVTSGNTGRFTVLRPFQSIKNTGLSFSAGLPYFVSDTGTWTSSETTKYVGMAIDTTEIYVDGVFFTNSESGASTKVPVSLIRR